MKHLLILTLITLTGCTVQVQDKRLTREDVAVALQQRDAAIAQLAAAVKELQPKKESKEK